MLAADVVPASWETAVVSLLFKEGARTDIKNYRSISLLDTDHKVLANALAVRMAQAMPRLLHPDQTAFVPGRRIQCDILELYIAQSFARRCAPSLLLMSCDMFKAYDGLDRRWILMALQRLGFPSYLTGWFFTSA